MIWLLLVLYQGKHFICDYPLQGRYMLGKFKPGNEWILPLLAHSAVHGVATLLIASVFKPRIAFWVALLDLVVHGCVDYLKANPKLGGRWKALSASEYMGVASLASQANSTNAELSLASKNAVQRLQSNVYFWWALGSDQAAHHLTHYIIIWSLLR